MITPAIPLTPASSVAPTVPVRVRSVLACLIDALCIALMILISLIPPALAVLLSLGEH